MANQNQQIAAIKKLSALYWSALRPDACREFDNIKGIDHEFYKVTTQLAEVGRKFYRDVDAARRELLATGFPVPNSWLTVEALAGVHDHQWRVGKSSKFRGRIDIKNAEGERVRAVLAEMYAAQMRLEAGGGETCEPRRTMSKREISDALDCDERTATIRLGDALRGAGQNWAVDLERCDPQYAELIKAYLKAHPTRLAKRRKAQQKAAQSAAK